LIPDEKDLVAVVRQCDRNKVRVCQVVCDRLFQVRDGTMTQEKILLIGVCVDRPQNMKGMISVLPKDEVVHLTFCEEELESGTESFLVLIRERGSLFSANMDFHV